MACRELTGDELATIGDILNHPQKPKKPKKPVKAYIGMTDREKVRKKNRKTNKRARVSRKRNR